jgi:hypothetical protein
MGLFRRLVRKALAKIAVESGGPNLKQKMSAPLSAMADHVERLDRRVSEHPYAPGRAWRDSGRLWHSRHTLQQQILDVYEINPSPVQWP